MYINEYTEYTRLFNKVVRLLWRTALRYQLVGFFHKSPKKQDGIHGKSCSKPDPNADYAKLGVKT